MKRNLLFILAGLTLGIGLPVFAFIPAETARFLPAHEVSAGTDAGERRYPERSHPMDFPGRLPAFRGYGLKEMADKRVYGAALIIIAGWGWRYMNGLSKEEFFN